MKHEPLIEALINVLVFLEFSDDHIINEDAAVSLLEQISASLKQLEPQAKTDFLKYLDYKVKTNPGLCSEELQYIRSLPEYLGLIVTE